MAFTTAAAAWAASAPVAAAAIGGTLAYSAYSGNQAARRQKTATNQARIDAQNAAKQADRAFNQANQKAPNVAALMKRNMDAGSQGVGGTYLTGNSGAPVASGMLGRSTLLGR